MLMATRLRQGAHSYVCVYTSWTLSMYMHHQQPFCLQENCMSVCFFVFFFFLLLLQQQLVNTYILQIQIVICTNIYTYIRSKVELLELKMLQHKWWQCKGGMYVIGEKTIYLHSLFTEQSANVGVYKLGSFQTDEEQKNSSNNILNAV